MKYALVTGSTKGIGNAIADMLGENGYIVRLFNPFNYPTNIELNSEILKANGAFSLNPYDNAT